MFEMLDAIDWSQVANSSGLSDAIPAAIRELVADDVGRRREALDMLWNLLEDQGIVYHASALSVPFESYKCYLKGLMFSIAWKICTRNEGICPHILHTLVL